MAHSVPTFSTDDVIRLWFQRQGLSVPRGTTKLDRPALDDHLHRTGALQLDSVNVVDRAHYLTLWSRFGPYDRARVDDMIYEDGAAYEYWGHEASILPVSHLPVGRRRMRSFPPPSWSDKSWWPAYATTSASKRRVLKRLRSEGPLESADFERRALEPEGDVLPWGGSFPKEDKRSLKLLWHAGRVAVRRRRHFRCVYDLAERVYPEGPIASRADYEDSWLMAGLSGCGIANERHLTNYFTAPSLKAADRKRVIARGVRSKRVVEVRVSGLRGPFYALAEHLDRLAEAPRPFGTTLICPFDSLLWQRKRASDLLGFDYKIEIYVPASKRRFGYYVLPILHDGRLVGRLDPKLHRDQSRLEVKAIFLEDGFERTDTFDAGLGQALGSLAEFCGATKVDVPRGWRGLRAAR